MPPCCSQQEKVNYKLQISDSRVVNYLGSKGEKKEHHCIWNVQNARKNPFESHITSNLKETSHYTAAVPNLHANSSLGHCAKENHNMHCCLNFWDHFNATWKWTRTMHARLYFTFHDAIKRHIDALVMVTRSVAIQLSLPDNQGKANTWYFCSQCTSLRHFLCQTLLHTNVKIELPRCSYTDSMWGCCKSLRSTRPLQKLVSLPEKCTTIG